MVDIRDPLHPAFAGCFSDPQTGRQGTGYSHDVQCVVYHGPDTKYTGRQICIGANETASVDRRCDRQGASGRDFARAVSERRVRAPGLAHRGSSLLLQDDELDEMQGLVDGNAHLIWD